MPIRVHVAAVPLIARVSLDPSASLGHMLGEERTREALQTLLRRLHRVVPNAARVARVGLLDLVYPVDPRRVNQGHDLGLALQAAARAAIVAVGGQALPAPDVRVAPWGSAGDQPSPAMDDALGPCAAHGLDAGTEHAIALLALLDARDPQAATHAWHVSVIAERLAAALGLDTLVRSQPATGRTSTATRRPPRPC